MRAGWIVLVAMVGWAVAADARPAGSKPSARRLHLADQWKSPVRPVPEEAVSEQRWRLADPVGYDAVDAGGMRWRLHGAKVKLRMPLALP